MLGPPLPQPVLNLSKIEEAPQLWKRKRWEGNAKSFYDNLGWNLSPKALGSVTPLLFVALWPPLAVAGPQRASLSSWQGWVSGPECGDSGSGICWSGVGCLLPGICWCERFQIPSDSAEFSPSALIFPLDSAKSSLSVCVTQRSQRDVTVEVWQLLLAMLIFSLGF